MRPVRVTLTDAVVGALGLSRPRTSTESNDTNIVQVPRNTDWVVAVSRAPRIAPEDRFAAKLESDVQTDDRVADPPIDDCGD